MEFSERVKALRKEKHLTQEEVAHRIGVSRRAYIAYEKNESRPRNRETYRKLADALGCDINDLLLEDNTVSSDSVANALKMLGAGAIAGVAAGSPIVAAAAGLALAAGGVAGVVKSKSGNGTKDAGSFSGSNELLVELKKRNKRFSAAALGMLYSSLSSLEVSFRPGKKDAIESPDAYPDEIIEIEGDAIHSWWLCFWAADPYLDGPPVMEYVDRALLLIGRFIACKPDAGRKISIVVDNEDLFDALVGLRGRNSYRGYLSAILIDTEDAEIKKEIFISSYSGEVDDEPLRISNEQGSSEQEQQY